MSTLSGFSTPAEIVDFPNDPDSQARLAQAWSDRVEGFTQQAIAGNPWNTTYASDQTWYYDPTDTDVPHGTQAVLVSWFAFPNRLQQYLGANAYPANPYNYTAQQVLELAEYGPSPMVPVETPERAKEVPSTLCPQADWSSPLKPYGPYGPRGWLDEYCEWSVVRNADGKITRVDFVCENPEYWYTFWSIDPQAVADAYTAALNWGAPPDQQVSVSVDDLLLIDPTTNEPVIDPSTGAYAYNPLNKWNSGTVSVRGSDSDFGGAIHLTSTPNTLQTELGLAGGATVQRQIGNSDPQALICCSQYGQEYRHSDPHIGQGVNQAVSGPPPSRVSLADPPGLYIQYPQAWGRYSLPKDRKLPPDAQPSDCWQIVRGVDTLADPIGGGDYPGQFMLHVAFQLPLSWIDAGVSFTVGDITIDGNPIEYAGQIAQTFQIGLFPRPLTVDDTPPAFPCVGTPEVQYPQPLQLFYEQVWEAYFDVQVDNPVGNPISLASNTVIVPPVAEQGASGLELALTCTGVTPGEAPTIEFPDGDLVASNVSAPSDAFYAVPGNSYPSDNQVVTFTLDVPPDAEPGLWSIQVGNAGQELGPPAPAFLKVVPAGSIG